MHRRFLILFLLTLSLLLPLTAAAGILDLLPRASSAGFVPRTADNIGKTLDEQVMRILTAAGFSRDAVSIACTVPVSLEDLRHTSPLARQMSEELARYFVAAGYRVDELRRGTEVIMTPDRGEFLLTRDVRKLLDRNVTTELLLVGTYTMTDQSVRFNMRLLHTPTNEVVAMAAGTVPVTEELAPLTSDNDTPPPPLAPSVRTRLPR